MVPVVHKGILSCLARPQMGTTSEGSKAIQVRYIVSNNFGPEIATHPVKLRGNKKKFIRKQPQVEAQDTRAILALPGGPYGALAVW